MTTRAAMSADGLYTLPNVFQRLMLQWERLAPYNAGQYMTLAGMIDPERAIHTWRDISIALGLQQVGQHPDARIQILPAAAVGQNANALLQAFVSAELNRSFAAGDSPLRPFMMLDGDRTHLGIIYRHVVADSASIRLVMRAWFDRLNDRRLPGHVTVAQVGSDRPSLWQTARTALREFPRVARAKRVRRLPADRADPTSVIIWRRIDLPWGAIDDALCYARRARVKLNDLFLAAAALACDEHLPCEGSPIRRELGLGTIVDVRSTGHPAVRSAQERFGLSLGFLQTFWRPQDLRRLETALAVAARVSRLARERGEAGASPVRFTLAERMGRSPSNLELAEFYRKRCPLAAGLSNVNLSRDWPARHHPTPLLAYTRVSPLGPMLPIVFTPTTLGRCANLGVTYRSSVLDEPTANALIDRFVRLVTCF